MEQLVQDMATSIRHGKPLPKMPIGLDLDAAYALQKDVVSAVSSGAVSGLKAGMTAPAGQQAFGLTGPIIGSLYQSGRLQPGASFAAAPGVMLECEIGIIVDADGAPQSAGPVIEVPRMAFHDEDDRTGANIVACNIAADRYILGAQQPWRDIYSDIQITLTRDGETLITAPATEALGGPHAALAWMLEETRAKGIAVQEGMLLITGACGGIHPAAPGHYVADYGSLGNIEFTVTDG